MNVTARLVATFLFATTVASTLMACGAGPGSKQPEDTAARCWDGSDNDGDGLIDCDDAECQGFDRCRIADGDADADSDADSDADADADTDADTDGDGDGDVDPLNRIGVRSGEPFAELFDTVTGERFEVTGMKYAHAAFGHHLLFEPGVYDPVAVDRTLSILAREGYNTVVVALDYGAGGDLVDSAECRGGCCDEVDGLRVCRPVFGIGGPRNSETLYEPYLENLLDFLRRANHYRLYAWLWPQWLPENAGYWRRAADEAGPHPNFVSLMHIFTMLPSFAEAKRRYLHDLAAAIRDADPGLLSTVLAWELEVNLTADASSPPFDEQSAEEGLVVETADGQSYDMGVFGLKDPNGRQACQDNNTIHYLSEAATGLKEIDPEALATAQMYSFLETCKSGPNGLDMSDVLPCGEQDYRFPARPRILSERMSEANLDFISFQPWYLREPSYEQYPWEKALSSSEIDQIGRTQTALLLDEIGAIRELLPEIDDAAGVVRQHRDEAVENRGFAGALFWNWDWGSGWTATEAFASIDRALAPSPALLYYDLFDHVDASTDWTDIRGTWTNPLRDYDPTNHPDRVLEQSMLDPAVGPAIRALEDLEVTDFEAEVRIRILEVTEEAGGGWAGLQFRKGIGASAVWEQGGGYLVHVRPEGVVTLVGYDAVLNTHVRLASADLERALLDEWIVMRVVAQDRAITVSIDGEPVLAFEDAEGGMMQGLLSLDTFGVVAQYDRLVVLQVPAGD